MERRSGCRQELNAEMDDLQSDSAAEHPSSAERDGLPIGIAATSGELHAIKEQRAMIPDEDAAAAAALAFGF